MDVGGNVMTDAGGALGVAPVIDTCAAGKDLVADANCQVTVPDLTVEMVASDNCSGCRTCLSPRTRPPERLLAWIPS